MSNYNFQNFTPHNYSYKRLSLENNNEIINEYEEKIKLLEKTFATLILLNNKRKIENEKNKIKIKYEIDNSLQEMKKEIQNHKKG